MSSFFDDLLTSDDSLANADPRTDDTVRSMLKEAASEGSVRTLRQAIERGQINRDTEQSIVDAAVHVIGTDKQANRLTVKEREKRAEFITEWVHAVAGPRPTLAKNEKTETLDVWNARVGSMLNACFSKYLHDHDHVASELIKMGAPTNGKFEASKNDQAQPAGAMTPLAGARLSTFEEAATVTVLARAIETRSRLVKDIIAAEPEALPIVARVKVGDQAQDVNAAGYALALGDAKILRDIVGGLSKRRDAADVREKMGQAIGQAESLGLLDFGPDEVLHGVVGLLAAGAELKDPAAFLARTITLVDVPGLANDPLATPAQAKEVQDAIKTSTYTLPAAMLQAPDAHAVGEALSSLVKMGWDVNQCVRPASLGEPTTDLRTCAHVAAFIGNTQVVSALQSLGCNLSKDDGAGRSPLDYARIGARTRGESLDLEFARIFDSKYELQPGDVVAKAKTIPASVNTLTTSKQAPVSAPKPSVHENSNSERAPVTAPKNDNFDDVNALAMMAFHETSDEGHQEIDYGDDSPMTRLKAPTAPPVNAPAAPAIPAGPAKPLSKFELLRQAQAARNAIPPAATATLRP